MPPDVRHLFVSPVAAGTSNRLVQGPNWNEAHNFQQGPQALLGRSDSTPGQAATQEVLLDPASMAFVGGKLASLGGTTPQNFGAVGDGTTIDDAAITAWLNYCAANGIKAVGTPGAVYKLSNGFHASIRTDFDGNGCEFVTGSTGVTTEPVFRIESMLVDIESVSLATVNTWTDLYRGSQKITQLANQQGWSYAFNTADAPVILRATATIATPDPAPILKGEAFEVVDKLGNLSKTIVGTYTMPFAQVTARRQRIRHNMVIKALHIRLTSADYNREKTIIIERPNTTLIACSIINETAFPVDRGYTHWWTTSIVYETCRAKQFEPTGTGSGQYGFDGYYTDNVTFRDCTTGGCRRGIDSINCSNYLIIGGSFPEGIGGHWIEGMYVTGRPFLSATHPNNIRIISVSGSNVIVESARIETTPTTTSVMAQRDDYPELRGIFRLGPNVDVIINETGDVPASQQIVSIMTVAIAAYATDGVQAQLRAVELPTIIDCIPRTIQQIGTPSDNLIALVSMPNRSAVDFSKNVTMPTTININPGALVLAAGNASGALRRVNCFLYKPDTAIGSGTCRVLIDNVPSIQVNSNIASATGRTVLGRYDIELNNVTDASSVVTVLAGAVRRALLSRVNTAVVPTISGTLLGDEEVRWDATTQTGTYTPTLTAVGNISSVSPLLLYYTITREGPLTTVDVHGQISAAATAAANTLTSLNISLPFPPAAFTTAAQLTGIASSSNGSIQAGIYADTSTSQALLQYLSAATGQTHWQGRFRYRV